MSIINDALRKTQESLGKNQHPDHPSSEQTASPDQHNPSQPVGWLVVVFLCVVLIIVGFFGSTLLNLFGQTKQTAMKANIPASNQNATPPKSSSGTANDSQDTPSLKLQGTMFMDGIYSALINDNIYKIGETVSGMEITNITLDQVQLNNGGTILILNVRNKRNL